jgi:polyferredoxin
VRNFWFRAAHLAAIVFVAGEALLGIWCPLTVWEDALRGVHAEKSFIARWIHRVLFYDLPAWTFTLAYVLFGLVVAATWWWLPPKKRGA